MPTMTRSSMTTTTTTHERAARDLTTCRCWPRAWRPGADGAQIDEVSTTMPPLVGRRGSADVAVELGDTDAGGNRRAVPVWVLVQKLEVDSTTMAEVAAVVGVAVVADDGGGADGMDSVAAGRLVRAMGRERTTGSGYQVAESRPVRQRRWHTHAEALGAATPAVVKTTRERSVAEERRRTRPAAPTNDARASLGT